MDRKVNQLYPIRNIKFTNSNISCFIRHQSVKLRTSNHQIRMAVIVSHRTVLVVQTSNICPAIATLTINSMGADCSIVCSTCIPQVSYINSRDTCAVEHIGHILDMSSACQTSQINMHQLSTLREHIFHNSCQLCSNNSLITEINSIQIVLVIEHVLTVWMQSHNIAINRSDIVDTVFQPSQNSVVLCSGDVCVSSLY